MRLAKCASITMKKCVVGINYTLEEGQYDNGLIDMDLDDKFDVILGLPWLKMHDPLIRWQHLSVNIYGSCS